MLDTSHISGNIGMPAFQDCHDYWCLCIRVVFFFFSISFYVFVHVVCLSTGPRACNKTYIISSVKSGCLKEASFNWICFAFQLRIRGLSIQRGATASTRGGRPGWSRSQRKMAHLHFPHSPHHMLGLMKTLCPSRRRNIMTS